MNLHLGGGVRTSRSKDLQNFTVCHPEDNMSLRGAESSATKRISVRHLCRIATRLSDSHKVQIAKLSERGRNPRQQSSLLSNVENFDDKTVNSVSKKFEQVSNNATLKTAEKTAGLPRSQGYLLPRNDMGEKAAFTLAEGATCVAQSAKPRRAAFTLAEVLITLGIIGVVAAITLPALIENVTERKNSERHANIVYKVTQAMDIMKAHGELSGTYPSTEAFVDELQKYLKISKRCDSNHIADCWPTEKVIDSDGNEFEVSKAKKGKNLSLNTDTNNVGLILADGASIILNYNPEVGKIDDTDPLVAVKKSLPVGGGRSKEFVYTSNSTASIDFVTDVNGSAHPNAETSNNKYHDIRNLAGAKFTKGCSGEDIPSVGCVVDLGQRLVWAEANAKCKSMGMELLDAGALRAVHSYKGSISSGFDYWTSQSGKVYNFISGPGNGYVSGAPSFIQAQVMCFGG